MQKYTSGPDSRVPVPPHKDCCKRCRGQMLTRLCSVCLPSCQRAEERSDQPAARTVGTACLSSHFPFLQLTYEQTKEKGIKIIFLSRCVPMEGSTENRWSKVSIQKFDFQNQIQLKNPQALGEGLQRRLQSLMSLSMREIDLVVHNPAQPVSPLVSLFHKEVTT